MNDTLLSPFGAMGVVLAIVFVGLYLMSILINDDDDDDEGGYR